MILQVQVTDSLFYDSSNFVGADTLDQCVELQSFFHSQFREDSVVLWAIADQLSGILELLLDVEALNRNHASCWSDFPRQTLESGRFSCAIDTKKSEAFTVVKTKRRLLDCSDGWTT